jgi:hypothetical protein
MDLKLNIEPYLYLYANDGKTKIPIGQFVVRIRQHKGIIVDYHDAFGQQVKTLYIGRTCYRGGYKLGQSKWHNPFKVKEYGSDNVCKMYRDYILKSELYNQLHELKGVLLMCFCDDISKCHGTVLRDLLNQLGN